MAEKPRDGAEQEEPQYEAPEAKELPTDATAETAPDGGPPTGVDFQVSDRNAKTGFAEVDVDAVLAVVRATPIAVHRQPRR